MRFFQGFLLAMVLLAPSAFAQEQGQADSPLARAVAEAKAQDQNTHQYAYVRHTRINSKDEVLDRVERYDPARPDGDRWELLLVDGQVPGDDQVADYIKSDKNKKNDSDISSVYSGIVADINLSDAELLEESDSEAVYRLLNVKSDFLGADGDELSGYLESRVVVDKSGSAPFVSLMRIYAPEPVKKGMVAKVNNFETAFSFIRHGQSMDVLPQEIRVEVSVEALLFFNVEAHTQVEFSAIEVRGG